MIVEKKISVSVIYRSCRISPLFCYLFYESKNGECDLSCSSPVILAYERGCNNVDGGGQRPIDPVPCASNENTRSTPQIQFSKSIGRQRRDSAVTTVALLPPNKNTNSFETKRKRESRSGWTMYWIGLALRCGVRPVVSTTPSTRQSKKTMIKVDFGERSLRGFTDYALNQSDRGRVSNGVKGNYCVDRFLNFKRLL